MSPADIFGAISLTAFVSTLILAMGLDVANTKARDD